MLGVSLPAIIDRHSRGEMLGRPYRQRCEICDKCTKGGKGFCAEHVEHMPYVKKVMVEITKQDEELEAVRKTNSIDPIKDDSNLVQEIINILYYRGSRTIKGMAKDLFIEPPTVAVYIDYLESKGRVVTTITRRKTDKRVDLAP